MVDVTEMFLKLVAYDTQSQHDAKQFPSTDKQLMLAEFLLEECRHIGLTQVEMDEYGYVTAVLPPNNTSNAPSIAFIAHMDTSPDSSGMDVKPQIIRSYDGTEIQLQNGLVLSPTEFPHLTNYKGWDIITTDGSTLLGADDKAGIAEILSAVSFLMDNPQIPHGRITICFTPDEEVGRGVDFLDTAKLQSDFGYTVDGGVVGEVSYENFNAARAVFEITGKSVHPGHAKDVLINASLIAHHIINCFPAGETPSTTEGYQGYYHLHAMSGHVETARLEYTLRDFEHDGLQRRKDFLTRITRKMNGIYGMNTVRLSIRDEYSNMRDVVEKNMNIYELARKAIEESGIAPITSPIRGGTDGCRLSFMGLPCPNIFTGGHNAHGPYEYIPIPSMKKAVEVIIKICELSTAYTS